MLRPSMNKFRAHQEDEAEIEIAKAFDRPMVCMLSRLVNCILDVHLRSPTFFQTTNHDIGGSRYVNVCFVPLSS